MKRIFSFIATNIVVLVVIRVVLAISGVNSTNQVGSLLTYSAVVGFSGSVVFLLMSKTIAKHPVGAVVINQPQSEEEAWLLAIVKAQARQWNLKASEVIIYNSPKPNAFVTDATKNSPLVAVSTGLLDHMIHDEVEAVLTHGVAYAGNGDIVTLTLIQGIANTSVVFLACIISSMMARNNDGSISQNTCFMVSMVLQAVLGFLASIIVMWSSCQREYRADAGAVKLVSAPKMTAALQRLKGNPSDLPRTMTAMSIVNDTKDSWFNTCPSLDNRISRLKDH